MASGRTNGAERSFEWNSPPPGAPLLSRTKNPVTRRREDPRRACSRATGQDTHSVLLGYDVFVNAPIPDKSDPSDIERLYVPEDFDFRLAPGSPAIAAGIALPNINDGFAGKAPDLGAYQLDQPLPHFTARDNNPCPVRGCEAGTLSIPIGRCYRRRVAIRCTARLGSARASQMSSSTAGCQGVNDGPARRRQ